MPSGQGPAAAAVERPRDRVPELDGIRGLAILIVIYGHYVVTPHAASRGAGWLFARTGILTWSGVDLFFVLSGFLIGGILIDARPAQSYFRTFYVRRALRILPLYVVVCGIGIILARTIPALIPILGPPMPLWAYATFTENFWLVHNSWDVYQAATWSLAIEEQFYLTLPLVIRVVAPRKLAATIAALAATSVVFRCVLFFAAGPGFHVLMPCRADGLMLGVVGAIVVRDPRLRQWLATTRWLRGAALLFGAGAGIYLWQGWELHSAPGATIGFTILALLYLALLMLAVCQPGSAWARLMRLPPLRRIGQLAYCLYLTNEPVFAAVRFVLNGGKPSDSSDWAAVAISCAVSVGLAELSWRLFESKLIAIGHRFSYGPRRALNPAPPSPVIS